MAHRRSRTDIHELPKLKGLRRALRKRLTQAEAAFWNMVKNGRLDGRKFRRQHSVGTYIYDFYCPSERLAIELDGQGHFVENPKLNDQSKRLFVEAQGIRLLRFENKLVFDDPEWVLAIIRSQFDWWRYDGAAARLEEPRRLRREPPRHPDKKRRDATPPS